MRYSSRPFRSGRRLASLFRAPRTSPLEVRRLLNYENLEGRLVLSAATLALNPDLAAADGVLVQLRDEAMGPSSLISAIPDLSRLTPGLKQLQLSGAVDLQAQLAALQSDPSVLFAEPNYAISILAQPNDPDFGSLWGLHNVGQTSGTVDADMDVLEAWDVTVGSGQTIVAVIDTGVDYAHVDLAANIWSNPGEIAGDGIDNDANGFIDDIHGYDFANNDADPMDDHNHGTHVAGTIGAVGNNNLGVVGVNWNVQIMPIKFLQSNGNGNIGAAIQALEYAVDNGARISNNSWGFNGGESLALTAAVAEAQESGHIFVAAAGNGNFAGVGLNNDATPFWPANAATDNVVSVAALDHNDEIATFSNYGAHSVDVGAPGVSILSTTIGNTYRTFSGTSMATPHAAGAIALLMDAHPTWSYQQVIDRVFTTVDAVDDLAGASTTGGRINLANMLAADVTAPSLVGVSPSGSVSSTLERIQIEFSEAIDGASFTTADVLSFTGPGGDVPVLEVTPKANTLGRVYEVVFERQTELGDYTIVFGSQVQDLAGNSLDLPGGTLSHQFTMLPFVGRYDFGRPTTAVEAGYTQITPASEYAPSTGYGWIAGGGIAVARGGGNDLSHDLIYAPDLAFVADAPNGSYDVTITIGDLGPYDHEQMEIRIEGALAANVSTVQGEVETLTFTNVAVGDGQFTLEMNDLGGEDPNVVINGLDVAWAGPDTVGPKVVGLQADGPSPGIIDRATIAFSEPLETGSFSLDDVISLTGRNGPIAVSSVQSATSSIYEVLFAPQKVVGQYELTLGANIQDPKGNLFDQDGDGQGGENPDDHFVGQFTIEPFSLAFDFGTFGSPEANGYDAVTPFTGYTAAGGYGWLGGGGTAVDRQTGGDLARDLIYAPDLTFVADVPDGVYQVDLTIGDFGPYAHDLIEVSLEDAAVDVVSTAAGQASTITYSAVTVSDGQLTLALHDLGGADANAVINGLSLTWLAEDQSAPRVVSATPDGDAASPVDRVVLTFSKPIDGATFTTSDVTGLAGPSGPIAVDAVNQLSDKQFEIVFAPQAENGAYIYDVGPDIRDLAGRQLDQDQDGTPGEFGDPLDNDIYGGSFNIAPLAVRFDFGPSFSPVADGFSQVTPTSNYTASQGYGWQSGFISAVDRGGADDAARDLVYASQLSFAADLPSGAYDVTLSLGDLGPYAHDAMEVYVEGLRIDTISTDAAEVVSATFTGVAIEDGQLNLQLVDTGGGDANVVINALEIVKSDSAAGPRVLSATPVGASGSIDRMRVVFNQAIDASTFTTADVSLTGPDGSPIFAAGVQALSANEFDVSLPLLTAVGDYQLNISADIANTSGDLLDQDGDGTGGENPDDWFTIVLAVPPFSAKFDFGLVFSPVESGFTQVTPNSGYTPALGYGYESDFVSAIDRFGGTSMTRDIHYADELIFAADVPDGLYEVTVHLGDKGPYVHEQMAVQLEGVQVDVVSTAASEVRAITYSNVSVADGKLQLHLVDVGGPDVNVVLAGLEIDTQPAGGSSAAAAIGELQAEPSHELEISFVAPPDQGAAGERGDRWSPPRRSQLSAVRDSAFAAADWSFAPAASSRGSLAATAQCTSLSANLESHGLRRAVDAAVDSVLVELEFGDLL